MSDNVYESAEMINSENSKDSPPPQDDNDNIAASSSADDPTDQPRIELNAHFPSFIVLRKALDKYQKERHVQLIVKDSKLLSAESTKRIIPKVYHLVNQSLMYHSITYCCKCHGALKQKPGSRIKNIGAKRLNCPMQLRFKLSADFQSLVLFDLYETHSHPTDFNTFQMSPRQQVYRLSRIQRGEPDPMESKPEEPVVTSSPDVDVQTLIATAIKDVNSVSTLKDTDYEPPKKKSRKTATTDSGTKADIENEPIEDGVEEDDDDDDDDEEENDDDIIYKDNPYTLLDPESSCSDSDEEEIRNQRHLLSYPVRLIGSAVQSSPELLALAKELIETQKENLLVAKKKLLLETKLLELKNTKLSLEVKNLEKTLATSSDQTTTFYLQQS